MPARQSSSVIEEVKEGKSDPEKGLGLTLGRVKVTMHAAPGAHQDDTNGTRWMLLHWGATAENSGGGQAERARGRYESTMLDTSLQALKMRNAAKNLLC